MRIHYVQPGVVQEQVYGVFYTLIARIINQVHAVVCMDYFAHCPSTTENSLKHIQMYSNGISNVRHKSNIYILIIHAYAEIVVHKRIMKMSYSYVIINL